MEVLTKTPQETQTIAANMAAQIISGEPTDHAPVIALEGELGAGKTTFVQGFTKSLGVGEAVKSPTFLLMKEYKLPERSLFHIDCYRVRDAQELIPLEIMDILNNPKNIVLIEWSERIAEILPSDRITVHLDHVDEHTRRITITP
jgi:tRNA threonylcarbamoyladenosine biosynthesis protein TsaE